MFKNEKEVYGDLLSRFILNLPRNEYLNWNRIMIQFQQAYWFYLDNYVDKYSLPKYKFPKFCLNIFNTFEIFENLNFNLIYNNFRKYLQTIKVCGGVLFNKNLDKILLVQCKLSGMWTFPKGKIDELESDIRCAIREIQEECGIDVKNYISEKEIFNKNIKGKNYTLFFMKDIPEIDEYQSKSPKEIKDVKWFDITKLEKIESHLVKPYLNDINEFRQQFIDKDTETFGITIKSWSAEEMFKINEIKFGVKQTVQKEEFNLSDDLMKKLDQILGRR